MWIHPEKKLIYVANPTTASRATQKALLEVGGYEPPLNHHATVDELRHAYLIGNFRRADWIVFATVRDPRDWFVSRYCGAVPVRRKPSVEGFQRWFPSAIREYLNVARKNRLFYIHWDTTDEFMKYERLGNDLTRIVGEPVPLEWDDSHRSRNKHEMPHWSECYTPGMEKQFRFSCPDFEAFGY